MCDGSIRPVWDDKAIAELRKRLAEPENEPMSPDMNPDYEHESVVILSVAEYDELVEKADRWDAHTQSGAVTEPPDDPFEETHLHHLL